MVTRITSHESARSQRKGMGKGKADDRTCYGCGKTGHLARNCPNPTKGRGKGKAKGSNFAGKGSWGPAWSQQPNGIKSLCAIAETPKKVQADLEGFVSPSRTTRSKTEIPRASLNCETQFFSNEVIESKEQETKPNHVKESLENKETSSEGFQKV